MLTVSIIIPVLNEEKNIVSTLQNLRNAFAECEIIVVDGGSTDQTRILAAPYARVLVSERGRSRQMNAGVTASSGDVLWFIHADTQVEPTALFYIQQVMAQNNIVGGGLTLQFDTKSILLYWVAKFSNMRAKSLKWIFGDQAFFVRREIFEEIGGFPDQPIMEDLEISRRLKKIGKLVLIPAVAKTSARRFLDGGIWKTILLMQKLKLQYFLGISPEELIRRYNEKKVKNP